MKVNEGNLQENLFFSRGYIYIYLFFCLFVLFFGAKLMYAIGHTVLPGNSVS